MDSMNKYVTQFEQGYEFHQDNISITAAIQEIEQRILRGEKQIRLVGQNSSVTAWMIANLTKIFEPQKIPLVVMVKDEFESQALSRNISFFMGISTQSISADAISYSTPKILRFPELSAKPWSELVTQGKPLMERMSTLFYLSQSVFSPVWLGSVGAFIRKIPPRYIWNKLVDWIQVGQDIDREKFIAQLVQSGYTRTMVCEDMGTYTVRGGILDVFIPLYQFPLRVELVGDTVESIRLFDPSSQKTLRSIDECYLCPIRETLPLDLQLIRENILNRSDEISFSSQKTNQLLEKIESGEDFLGKDALSPAYYTELVSLFSYFHPQSIILLVEPHEIDIHRREILSQSQRSYEDLLAQNEFVFPPEKFFLTNEQWSTELSNRTLLQVSSLLIHEDSTSILDETKYVVPCVELHKNLAQELLGVKNQQKRKEKLLAPWVERLQKEYAAYRQITIVAPSLGQATKLEQLLKSYELKVRVHHFWLEQQSTTSKFIQIQVGTLTNGFSLPLDGIAFYSESELLGDTARKRSFESSHKRFVIDTFKDLDVGSFLVHQLHGIGRYLGLVKLSIMGKEKAPADFMHIEYSGGKLYLPIFRLSEVQRYLAPDQAPPPLDKLGGDTWFKTRAKVSLEVKKLAEELLQLYAKRAMLQRKQFSLDEFSTSMFAEFEAMFPYEETPDQEKAIQEVLLDLQSHRPMDRLLCGDVGYGKTEVAIRAAAYVALSGQQVAVLVPTTILAEQHKNRFEERCKQLPLKIGVLSRFSSHTTQKETLKKLSQGEIDIIVGTHRLLSKDVQFKNLGLLIVDEEQKFGVAHKERIRQLRSHVDTLTLTATPIPRTLHMAFSGLREISLIHTPPLERLSVKTLLVKTSDDVIIEGISRELARGGQVFFLHNRVSTIGKWAKHLQDLFPSARIVVGHGQMEPVELERVMFDFIDGKADILLCTTIIENGIDIARANTLFVDRADLFGLSQLYQIRGRVGRSKERAYCYLMVPKEQALGEEAKSRLSVLQRFSELGSGFQIASQDLELRGAGELLGGKQSGQIALIGFDSYFQMLKDAVLELEGKPISKNEHIDITSDLPSLIPDDYISEMSWRLEMYRRFSLCDELDDVLDIYSEMEDRYGTAPFEVQCLVGITKLRVLAKKMFIVSIELTKSRFAFGVDTLSVLAETQRYLPMVQKQQNRYRIAQDGRWIYPFQNQTEQDARLEIAIQQLVFLQGLTP